MDAILRTGSLDAAHIQRTHSGLLDFCGYEPMLALYEHHARRYWGDRPIAISDYIDSCCERWEATRGSS